MSESERGRLARDHLRLAVNGALHEVRGDDAFLPLSTWLRERLRLVGTKIVCSEGDCGACTVLVGRQATESNASGPRVGTSPVPSGASRIQYTSLDSCIAFLYQLDGAHVVTVDALGAGGALHPVQRAMVEKFGSQCGYCTPGFVMALAALGEEARARGSAPDDSDLRTGLSGNLCRCTGYVQILDAARAVDPLAGPGIEELFDPASLFGPAGPLAGARRESVRVEAGARAISIPATWAEALDLKRLHPEATVVAGATDVGVQVNKGIRTPERVLHLRPELDGFAEVEVRDGALRLGAGARWSAVLDVARSHLPELARILELFGAPQIRNAGTVGGNLVNASPIADSLPLLYVLEANVQIDSTRGRRSLPIAELYRGYKELALAADELVAGVAVPLPRAGEAVRLLKVSRRRDLDISTFTAALWLRRSRPERIDAARIALGGVGPTVVRAPGAETLLAGAPFELASFRAAGESAAAEIRPISDVRGSEAYRRLLARNALVRFFHELAGESEPSPARAGARA